MQGRHKRCPLAPTTTTTATTDTTQKHNNLKHCSTYWFLDDKWLALALGMPLSGAHQTSSHITNGQTCTQPPLPSSGQQTNKLRSKPTAQQRTDIPVIWPQQLLSIREQNLQLKSDTCLRQFSPMPKKHFVHRQVAYLGRFVYRLSGKILVFLLLRTHLDLSQRDDVVPIWWWNSKKWSLQSCQPEVIRKRQGNHLFSAGKMLARATMYSAIDR